MPESPGLPDLSGLVALVTGAGGNVGRGIARRLAAAGAAVVAHYWSSADSARKLAEEIRSAGGAADWERADLRDPADVDALVRAVVEKFGRVDVLVNNAGVQPVCPLPEMGFGQWRDMFGGNVDSTFLTTQAVARQLISQGHGGSITSIASIEALQPAPNHAHYSASKAAVLMYARAAALEYAPHGIRVNVVSPGLIGHEGLDEEWPDGVARWVDAAPLGRLGTPEDVGNACAFLASPLAGWITGQNLVVDGGVSARPTW
ncbi:short-chain dehydrogenase [Longimycelium tulufanense]|uniref:Short-chain dehydrogenase n=1 Tax=Longimycelium tulufanense TaxID=907463 RepID=A0A8J3CBY6_9PSEU|nr:SDR family NAD(P)-dependent oxidoreductase [Longimycelium tulufanense]GGM56598.1 short-chain dehydrogenase [Longimycelium tulufanense]